MRYLVLLLVFLFGLSSAYAQRIDFKADITNMNPMSYPSQSGLFDFSFEMHGDSVDIYLPYMGEVHTTTFGNDGLNFKAVCSDLKVKPTKKKDGQELSFCVMHDIVSYKFNITLYDNNTIYIYVIPSNAQSCSYSGRWEKNEQICNLSQNETTKRR